MRKLLSLLGAVILTFSPTSFLVSCYFGDIDGTDFLKSIKNFAWDDPEKGDGIAIDNANNQNALTDVVNVHDLGVVAPQHAGSFLNYTDFGTGFQWNQNILKQAATGAPLNKGFMPNGNSEADFGVTAASRRYLHLNSILDWSPSTDNDAKYDVADVQLQPREYVATNNESQNKNVKYNQLGFSSRKHRTFDNTVVGTKNPFEYATTDWQYINNFTNWSGSWFEGPIIPPPADVIDAAHVNGTPIFGNIFLDGSHGLTKDMLKDFLAKNADGSYKVVDFLIKVAKYMKFDGWFLNYEANGYFPNGTIMSYDQMSEIMQQFYEKVGASVDPAVHRLSMNVYKAWGNVIKDSGGYEDDAMIKFSQVGYNDTDGKRIHPNLQLTFETLQRETTKFIEDNKDYASNDLYSMFDMHGNSNYWGTYDYRQNVYAMLQPGPEPIYNKKNNISFSNYVDNGASFFGQYAYDWDKKNNKNVDNKDAYLFATQVTNLANAMQFSGTNTFVRTATNSDPNGYDNGLQQNGFVNDYKDFTTDVKNDYYHQVFAADPRIRAKNKKASEAAPIVMQKVYDYKNDGLGYNSSSYGVGSLVPEKTTLFDDTQALNVATDFSMGSGIKFVSRNQANKPIVFSDYPWTNKRLTDLAPTYQWRIYADGKPNQPLPIDRISGAYDYDRIYRKGNSIAIGNGFDENGHVLPARWDLSQKYDWDIMGTNLVHTNHEVNFIYKDGDSNVKNSNVKLLVTTTNQNSGLSRSVALAPSTVKVLNDGWTEIGINLKAVDGVNDVNRISRLGLQIMPTSNEFKFNVGEFRISTPDSVRQSQSVGIVNPQSEYVVNRNVKGQTLSNVRFAWSALSNLNVSYYEVYYFFDNKWYRVGETKQNCYYVHDLKPDGGVVKLAIAPVVNGEFTNNLYAFEIETK